MFEESAVESDLIFWNLVSFDTVLKPVHCVQKAAKTFLFQSSDGEPLERKCE